MSFISREVRLRSRASGAATVDNVEIETVEDAAPAPDLYFDNVGGSHLDTALASVNSSARIVPCGTMADYNTAEALAGIENAPRSFLELFSGKNTAKMLVRLDG